MIPTPYLKGFNTDGGTLYVFPSVSKDLTRTFVSNDYEFKFSHFACLNIPDIKTGKYVEIENWETYLDHRGLYLSTLAPEGWSIENEDYGKAIAENLQNYVMNFETAILNGEGDNDDYDPDILTNVSEKVFFNWLQKVGAIRFDETGRQEVYKEYADRTVQYIGNIDVMNTVDINGDSFEEIYIHIPSTVGASTNVYFRLGDETDNKNYLSKYYSLGGDGEYIEGRTSEDENPYGLNIEAFTDIDDGVNVYIGDIGHTIDFRNTSYSGGSGINYMNGNSLEDFEFNVVLIYYDIFEKTSTVGVKKTATNLYGVLFLDNVRTEAGATYIQRYPKIRETVYGNGNSYALKLDLKIDTIGDTSWKYIEKIQDPNSIVSMSLFTRAMEQLQKCVDFFFTQKIELAKLAEKVNTLENISMGIDSVASIRNDVNTLMDRMDSYGVLDKSTILGLINKNTRTIESIMSGEKNVKLQYDMDVLQPGHGIGMTKSMNKVVISSEDKYVINTVTDGSTDDETEIDEENPLITTSLKPCSIKLKPGENFAVIHIEDQGDCIDNLNINIDDSDYNWDVGQSMKIYFDGSLRFGDIDNGIIIKPQTNTSLFITGYDFNGNNLIEVICVGEGKFVYLMK